MNIGILVSIAFMLSNYIREDPYSHNTYELYLDYKYLEKEEITEQEQASNQIVITEEQLITLRPIHLKHVEIIPTTANTVAIKGTPGMLSIIHWRLYSDKYREHYERE